MLILSATIIMTIMLISQKSILNLKLNTIRLNFVALASLIAIINFNKYNNDIMLLNEWFSSIVLGYDNLTLILLLLTALLVIFCLLISWSNVKFLEKEFILLLIISLIILIVIFSIFDFIVFYVFFEALLIPIFLIINIWGSRKEKFNASYYLFFFTLFGSLVMLICIINIYSQANLLSVLFLNYISLNYQSWLFLGISLSFIIKIPMVPFHIWLPQAHVEAPIAGSILLAGILLKLEIYGFIRFAILLLSNINQGIMAALIVLSILSIIFGSFLTMRQIDIKRLIAYSSVAHMGFCSLAIFSLNLYGWLASIILMLSHGFVSSGLFMSATILYDRFHSRIIRYYKGILISMPIFSSIVMLFLLANVAFPGSLNLWGELLTFKSCLQSKFSVFSCLMIVLSMLISAIYSFNIINKVFFGVVSPLLKFIRDINKREFYSLIIVLSLPWVSGFYPCWLMNYSKYFIYYNFILN